MPWLRLSLSLFYGFSKSHKKLLTGEKKIANSLDAKKGFCIVVFMVVTKERLDSLSCLGWVFSRNGRKVEIFQLKTYQGGHWFVQPSDGEAEGLEKPSGCLSYRQAVRAARDWLRS